MPLNRYEALTKQAAVDSVTIELFDGVTATEQFSKLNNAVDGFRTNIWDIPSGGYMLRIDAAYGTNNKLTAIGASGQTKEDAYADFLKQLELRCIQEKHLLYIGATTYSRDDVRVIAITRDSNKWTLTPVEPHGPNKPARRAGLHIVDNHSAPSI
jgi:hypothetical protein